VGILESLTTPYRDFASIQSLPARSFFPVPPSAMEWQEIRHRMIVPEFTLPAPTDSGKTCRRRCCDNETAEPSTGVSSQEASDLDPSLSHRSVLFFLSTSPPRTNPSAPFTPSQTFFLPSRHAYRKLDIHVYLTTLNLRLRNPSTVPQPRAAVTTTAAAVIVGTPAPHPQSTPYVHTVSPVAAPCATIDNARQGRVPTFPPDLALPDGAAQAELPDSVPFSLARLPFYSCLILQAATGE
jgi:hypothetical protein